MCGEGMKRFVCEVKGLGRLELSTLYTWFSPRFNVEMLRRLNEMKRGTGDNVLSEELSLALSTPRSRMVVRTVCGLTSLPHAVITSE